MRYVLGLLQYIEVILTICDTLEINVNKAVLSKFIIISISINKRFQSLAFPSVVYIEYYVNCQQQFTQFTRVLKIICAMQLAVLTIRPRP